MSRIWFGTDGVRGPAGEGPLAAPFLRRLGRALGEQAGAESLVLLARDTRESGPAIAASLAAGLSASGARPLDLGVLPTPGLPLAMRARGAALGVVVSASHNPWRDNGVKVFGAGGHKLDDASEQALEARVDELGGVADDGHSEPDPTLTCEDGAAEYVEAISARFADLDLAGMDLAVDCAHGAATHTAVPVLRALGARVSALAIEPDGRNINADCGSTHLASVASAVVAGGHELGLAFDGDADRVLLVDAAGRACTGDAMLGLLGPWMASRGRLPDATVVATVMSNLGLERLLASHGLSLLRTPVGDRYVSAAMRRGGYGLGGEDSGHLLFGASEDHPGDGLFTALYVLTALLGTGCTVGDAIDAVPAVPQRLLNVQVAARPPLERLPAVTARVADLEAEHGADLRIVLRYSGTENLARVMVEGTEGQVVDRVTDELAALWVEQIEAAGRPAR
ncbi:MAG: phosphoglucosamine mutase [Planctomycetota bacterium]|nr:MAG: phosphoglucosamine mutase [Planctomycetota bacterium]